VCIQAIPCQFVRIGHHLARILPRVRAPKDGR
jgi:hypothetical protein